VGSRRICKADVRIVGATNEDLKARVADGRFREDLYYRLHVMPVRLAPLRERREDIALLADHFIAKFNERLRKQIEGISTDAIQRLVAHPWPGNIRELENLMERTVLFCEGPQILVSDLPPEISHLAPVTLPHLAPVTLPHLPTVAAPPPEDLARAPSTAAGLAASSLNEAVRAQTERVERELIQRALDETGGNVTQAARKLKISRKSLQTKMKEFGLRDQARGD